MKSNERNVKHKRVHQKRLLKPRRVEEAKMTKLQGAAVLLGDWMSPRTWAKTYY